MCLFTAHRSLLIAHALVIDKALGFLYFSIDLLAQIPRREAQQKIDFRFMTEGPR
jgi:hypothetical protein